MLNLKAKKKKENTSGLPGEYLQIKVHSSSSYENYILNIPR